jgi:hypothetical protein
MVPKRYHSIIKQNTRKPSSVSGLFFKNPLIFLLCLSTWPLSSSRRYTVTECFTKQSNKVVHMLETGADYRNASNIVMKQMNGRSGGVQTCFVILS